MISFSHFFEGERVVVGGHGCRAALHFGVKAREGQGRVLALCWLSRLHREPYGAEFIAISGSCTATELSKLLASCLTAVEERAVRYCEKVYERSCKNLLWSIENSGDVLDGLRMEVSVRAVSLLVFFCYLRCFASWFVWRWAY